MQTYTPAVVLLTPDGGASTFDIETTTDPAVQLRILAGRLRTAEADVQVYRAEHARVIYRDTGGEPNAVAAAVLARWLLLPDQPLTGPVVLTGHQHEDDDGPLRNHPTRDLAVIRRYWIRSRIALL